MKKFIKNLIQPHTNRYSFINFPLIIFIFIIIENYTWRFHHVNCPFTEGKGPFNYQSVGTVMKCFEK